MQHATCKISRLRYFRGHGIHSPFVYGIVREVFMQRKLQSGDHALFDALRAGGITNRRAVQLQNLAVHCGCRSWAIDGADAEFCILTRDLPCAELQKLTTAATEQQHTVAVMSPGSDKDRKALCDRIVAEHASTTVDNRAYLLIFNDDLPKQHFRL